MVSFVAESWQWSRDTSGASSMNSAPVERPIVFTEPDGNRNVARSGTDSSLSRIHIYRAFSLGGASVFFSQQAAEKALKALLIKRTRNFPKIHDLTKLARMNDAPEKIVELCAKINPAYTATRYPDTAGSYSESEAKQVIKYCREVLVWTEEKINS